MGWARAERVLLTTMFGRNKENQRLQEKREKDQSVGEWVWLEFGSAFRARQISAVHLCSCCKKKKQRRHQLTFSVPSVCLERRRNSCRSASQSESPWKYHSRQRRPLPPFLPTAREGCPDAPGLAEKREKTGQQWCLINKTQRIDSVGYESRSGCKRSWVQIPDEPAVFVRLGLQWFAWFELNCPLGAKSPNALVEGTLAG